VIIFWAKIRKRRKTKEERRENFSKKRKKTRDFFAFSHWPLAISFFFDKNGLLFNAIQRAISERLSLNAIHCHSMP
jgi:hypothetical protein